MFAPLVHAILSVNMLCLRNGLVTKRLPRSIIHGLARYYSARMPPSYSTRKKFKSADQEKEEMLQEKMKSDKWWVRWSAFAQTKKFNSGLTKFLIATYIGFLIYGGYHFKDMYSREKETNTLSKKKYGNGETRPQKLNEYEELRLKELTGKLRNRDQLMLGKYKDMIKEKEDTFYSDPKNVGEEFKVDYHDFDGMKLGGHKENDENACILPARDTSEFYDSKAADYDSDINFEEKMIFLGRRRKWLMSKAFGDVLEVACGTGRNIKYLDANSIDSITYLDPSRKMIEVANEKFREKYPKYQKAAFVVGKAEDLIKLAGGEEPSVSKYQDNSDKDSEIESVDVNTKVKYDTIIESFGICSHENPVKALNNFSKLLKPGGRIILLEHGRGTWDVVNNHLDKRAEKRLETWGCRWNLDIGELLDDSGLEIVEESRHQFGTLWCIVAKKPGDTKRYDELSLFEKYFTTL
ncbi:putative RNA methyltransferase [Saccharomycopsis crataegensis]|uniref:RNA methyltransferase n=1 Tax=Saccharomycopsis crataegensis TaxID=43959 RepID=A0AAV5QK83_9ASCO|nr:putative RNA methyltransferase [Saccharomycopsis crataegensis]